MTDAFGAYLHVPFCRHRCDYCAFATFTDRDHLMLRYVEAVSTEIDRARAAGHPPFTTVFVGGGTPTRLDPTLLARLLGRLDRRADAEVTIECNPDDVTDEMFSVYRDAGVNRVSIGVQSMVESTLVSLGRTHDPDNVFRAVETARRQGIDNVNLDVIYGAPGETLADWERTIRSVIALEPPHVSAYGLTIEAGTPFAADPRRHPDDDLQAEMYEMADELLTAAGRSNYEVSNWAVPGAECRHNQLYWRQGEYLGFGSAAHSHRNGRRWWNARTPDRFCELIEEGRSAESSAEELDADERRLEGLQLAIRTRDGVPSDALAEHDKEVLDGLIVDDGTRVTLTRRGRLMANEVSVRLR